MNFVQLLNRQISELRTGNKVLVVSACITLFIGLGLISLAFILNDAYGAEWIKLGGGIVSTVLTGIPVTQILNRRERIISYTEVLMCFDDCEQQPPECRRQCEKYAEKVLEETGKR